MFDSNFWAKTTVNRGAPDCGWILKKCMGFVTLFETKQKNDENANPIPIENFVATIYG